MAELAECHAIADIVVFAFAPRDDVGGINNGMPFRRDDSHHTQGEAVVVSRDHDAPEALITGCGLVGFCRQRFLYQRQVGLLLQFLAVFVCFGIDGIL